MKKYIGIWALAILSACGSNTPGKVTISGTIENAIPQGEVVLERFEIGQASPVKTVYSDHEGNFSMDLELSEPGFYRLNIYGEQFETLVLDNENIKVKAAGKAGEFIEATGSDDMDNLKEVYAYLDTYQAKMQGINQRFLTAQSEGNQELMEELRAQALELETAKVDRLKKMAMSFESSLVSLLITDFISNKTDEFAFLDSLATKLQKEIPNSSDVQYFAENIEAFRPAVAMGEVAPDITMETPDGEMLSLSDLRGKYVLLDFWAAWCKPCRMENPNVVRMYEKYNDEGFEVFSVSLDRSKQQWIDAIEKDGLVWPYHVSDLKYFQSSAAITYKINAIPFALLLDPEGRVIGKNLRGRALEAKLASIFGE
ncbi:MAG: TlpA disulfide reductase family protein [Bacteroidota bacterium]|nr:TlpA disulfide reductase family protein [Bacteroidota bacterium]